jgi:hypothetical protein
MALWRSYGLANATRRKAQSCPLWMRKMVVGFCRSQEDKNCPSEAVWDIIDVILCIILILNVREDDSRAQELSECNDTESSLGL